MKKTQLFFRTNSFFSRISAVAFVCLLLSVKGLAQESADISAGESLFRQKCTACHAIDRVVIGPALGGVTEGKSKEWLHKWIKNSQAFIKSGDADAVAIFEEYDKKVMTAFPELSTSDIDNILAYVEHENNKPKETAVNTGLSEENKKAQEKESREVSLWVLGGVCVFLLVLILLLLKSSSILDRSLKLKKGEKVEASTEREGESFFKKHILRKKKKIFFILVFLELISVVYWLNFAWHIGVQQGYQPAQPIAFSHELHAGTNQIDCGYCHGDAWKGKHANIPSLNVCMNCHDYVQATEKYGGEISPEIAKIYKALDYDPKTKKYGDNPKPIQWVRIHNLPDFVYFNHSQHVKVAGLKCQRCHGPVETMKEVYQYSPLTMGWCVDCHRTTKAEHAKGNAYYDKLLKAHEDIKNGTMPTVAVLGGIECGKCHY